MSQDAAIAVPDGPAGLLISRDLFFISKVVGTAQVLGHRIISAGNKALIAANLAAWKPVVVFVDLAAGELISPATLIEFRTATPGTPFLAFGAHVDTEQLRLAQQAGCDPVLPRSRFTQELPDIIRGYFETPVV